MLYCIRWPQSNFLSCVSLYQSTLCGQIRLQRMQEENEAAISQTGALQIRGPPLDMKEPKGQKKGNNASKEVLEQKTDPSFPHKSNLLPDRTNIWELLKSVTANLKWSCVKTRKDPNLHFRFSKSSFLSLFNVHDSDFVRGEKFGFDNSSVQTDSCASFVAPHKLLEHDKLRVQIVILISSSLQRWVKFFAKHR